MRGGGGLHYDSGSGLGAVGFGLVVGPVGYPVALTAAVLFAALRPACLA